MKIVHAPNHRNLKGTEFMISEIEKLKSKGFSIDFNVLEGIDNKRVINEVKNADIVIDQLIIGWYAVFSIEGMACSKCTMCYLEEELLDFYIYKKLLSSPPPIVNINLKISLVK